LKTVVSATSAARAISATVTSSKPRSTKSSRAVSAISWRVCCFLRSRRPGSVVAEGVIARTP
jgi:hypothetical protein